VNLLAGQDASINGAIVAGGSIGANGISWFGAGDSDVNVVAGQRILLDTGISASRTVSLSTTAAPGADDDGLSVRITSAGGLTTAGLTSDGSGGLVAIDAVGHVDAGGSNRSGGTVTQTFDDGKLIAENVSWSTENSSVDPKAGGQL